MLMLVCHELTHDNIHFFVQLEFLDRQLLCYKLIDLELSYSQLHLYLYLFHHPHRNLINSKHDPDWSIVPQRL
ncbi:hypothetical protein N0V86_005109 [Didymella sp. IMI 355093]|nr:hypothetical protein N0V86_005109 [Didymella sp. IMI 355093]